MSGLERREFPSLNPIGGRLQELARRVSVKGESALDVLREMMGIADLNETQTRALNEFAKQIDIRLDKARRDGVSQSAQINRVVAAIADGPLLRNTLKVIVGEELGRFRKRGSYSSSNEDAAIQGAVDEITDAILSSGTDINPRVNSTVERLLGTVEEVRMRVSDELTQLATARGDQGVASTVEGRPICENGVRAMMAGSSLLRDQTLPTSAEVAAAVRAANPTGDE